MEFGGRVLPAGASIVPSIHLVHRRPDIYPEPNEFRPERFLESEGGRPPGTYTWIPFGGGIRRCLGAAFAQFEMEVVLRELVLARTLAPARPESERNYRRAITETPRHDATVIVGRCPVTGTTPEHEEATAVDPSTESIPPAEGAPGAEAPPTTEVSPAAEAAPATEAIPA